MGETRLDISHPLRRLFRAALAQSAAYTPELREKPQLSAYLEEEVLCRFLHADMLWRLRDARGRRLEDVADMLAEADALHGAPSYDREFSMHKHIGDYTLFMLGLFAQYLRRKRGKELLLGALVVPGGTLAELYALQGSRSYQVASVLSGQALYRDLSEHYEALRGALEMVRIYLEACREGTYQRARELLID